LQVLLFSLEMAISRDRSNDYTHKYCFTLKVINAIFRREINPPTRNLCLFCKAHISLVQTRRPTDLQVSPRQRRSTAMQPKYRRLFSYTYKMLFAQPFSFHIHTKLPGVYPLRGRKFPCFRRSVLGFGSACPRIGPAPQLCDNPGLALPRPSRLT